jgi:hypothetical protein
MAAGVAIATSYGRLARLAAPGPEEAWVIVKAQRGVTARRIYELVDG